MSGALRPIEPVDTARKQSGARLSFFDCSFAMPRLRGALAHVHATDGADLRIEFADHTRLTVRSDLDFEAWTVAALEGFKAVSVVGGGLTVWD